MAAVSSEAAEADCRQGRSAAGRRLQTRPQRCRPKTRVARAPHNRETAKDRAAARAAKQSDKQMTRRTASGHHVAQSSSSPELDSGTAASACAAAEGLGGWTWLNAGMDSRLAWRGGIRERGGASGLSGTACMAAVTSSSSRSGDRRSGFSGTGGGEGPESRSDDQSESSGTVEP